MGIIFPIIGAVFVVAGFGAPGHDYPLTGWPDIQCFSLKAYWKRTQSWIKIYIHFNRVSVRCCTAVFIVAGFLRHHFYFPFFQPFRRILCWILCRCRESGSSWSSEDSSSAQFPSTSADTGTSSCIWLKIHTIIPSKWNLFRSWIWLPWKGPDLQWCYRCQYPRYRGILVADT